MAVPLLAAGVPYSAVRIPVLSDVHANLAALEAVIADAADAGTDTPPWVLGDIVGYGPDPTEVIDRLRGLGAKAIAGNHDLAAAGLIAIDDFNPLAAAAVRWTAGIIDDTAREYLASLPARLEEGDFTLVHGSPRDPVWEYLTSAEAITECLAHFSTPVCLFGHTHVPIVIDASSSDLAVTQFTSAEPLRLAAERMYVNPGSVGQPRDGDPRASYAIVEPDTSTIEFRRVAYDIATTQARMRRARLPGPLINRLAFGR
jgi:diadenosine tetraphosphatase ApaH/serine/threonine PP2A family protein phosphatase